MADIDVIEREVQKLAGSGGPGAVETVLAFVEGWDLWYNRPVVFGGAVSDVPDFERLPKSKSVIIPSLKAAIASYVGTDGPVDIVYNLVVNWKTWYPAYAEEQSAFDDVWESEEDDAIYGSLTYGSADSGEQGS